MTTEEHWESNCHCYFPIGVSVEIVSTFKIRLLKRFFAYSCNKNYPI